MKGNIFTGSSWAVDSFGGRHPTATEAGAAGTGIEHESKTGPKMEPRTVRLKALGLHPGHSGQGAFLAVTLNSPLQTWCFDARGQLSDSVVQECAPHHQTLPVPQGTARTTAVSELGRARDRISWFIFTVSLSAETERLSP